MLSTLKYTPHPTHISYFPWHSALPLNLPLHLLPPLYISASRLPNIALSPSLAPCPLTSLPLAATVTQSYPSCHQKGNGRQQQGVTGGGDRMMLPAVLAPALACRDTRKQPILHPRFIFFTVGCQWRHSAWSLALP